MGFLSMSCFWEKGAVSDDHLSEGWMSLLQRPTNLPQFWNLSFGFEFS